MVEETSSAGICPLAAAGFALISALYQGGEVGMKVSPEARLADRGVDDPVLIDAILGAGRALDVANDLSDVGRDGSRLRVRHLPP